MLELSDSTLARIVDVGQSKVVRGIGPNSETNQLTLLLVCVFQSLASLVGLDDRRCKKWTGSQNTALSGKLHSVSFFRVKQLFVSMCTAEEAA